MMGHFQIRCKSKQVKPQKIDRPQKTNQKRVHQIKEGEPYYAFTVRKISENNCDSAIDVKVGGINLPMIIDSGASCNILGREQWETLRANNIQCVSSKETKTLYAYGSTEPLEVAGAFKATVSVGNDSVENEEFVVIEGAGQSLLGRDTALKLNVLKLGPSVNVINDRGILNQYPEVIKGFGKLKNFQLKVPLDRTVTPVVQTVRRIPYQLRDKLEHTLQELEQLDIIEPVNGPCDWVSPIVCVPKANGKDIRICVDMRRANLAVKRERFPIPTIAEILQDLNQSCVFSKLDLRMGYHQIELHQESREITTFATHKGLYRDKCLMMGINCAPEMYQKCIQQLIQNIEGAHNILDDIIVHGSSKEEHDKRLARVLETLRDNGLTLNMDKCELNMSKLVFMGHVLSARGIGPAEVKVQAVVNAREPETEVEVKSFLGLVTYSSRYIPDFSTVSEPLRRLLKSNEPFIWGDEQQESFDKLKSLLADADTLGYYDMNAKTQVITDASPVGLGAVLVQEQGGEYRVICYASRSLTDVERRYSQTEKEALAIVWACERLHPYLYGIQFELLTDHKPLEFIYSPKSKPCARIERWVLRMQQYTYTVRWIPGNSNIADSLSRLLPKTAKKSPTSDADSEYIRFVAEEATPKAVSTKEIERASDDDAELSSIRQCLLTGRWYSVENKQYIPVRFELSAIGKLVLRGTRIVKPESLCDRILKVAHEGHPRIVNMKKILRSKVWWPGIDKQVEQYCKTCYRCQLVSQPTKPEPMSRTELPDGPWQHLAADLLGPLPTGESILVLVDYYSRFFEVEIMKSTTSDKVIKALNKFFVTHGLPFSVKTDNGPQFVSESFKNFMSENGITHRHTTPLWPQANGEVERQNRAIMKRIRLPMQIVAIGRKIC